jgi:hypothetical protein
MRKRRSKRRRAKERLSGVSSLSPSLETAGDR